jgi:hypothetical protein
MTTLRTLAVAAVSAAAAIAVTTSAFAQAQFRDEKTGKIWTPDNVSKETQVRPSNEPVTAADKAFDPKTQIATATGVVVQRPNAQLMGIVPITAGPTMPLVTLDSTTLQAIPGDRWVAPLYISNNSGGEVNAQVGCTFTNGGRSVQENRIVVPTAGPGQRLAFVAYGPRTDIFVDRVLCRVLTP